MHLETRVARLHGALLALVVLGVAPLPASAQTAPQPAAAAQPQRADPDLAVDPLQPDFNLAALPTTLRMPDGKWSFRVTHRFTRPLGQGDFGDLLSDAFGIDGGAQIGLEVRYGLFTGTQVGVHRTSDRTIQIFGQHSFLNERDGAPVGLDALIALEGENNLREHHQGGFGMLVSRKVARHAALYAEPIVVVNSSGFETGDNSTLVVGFGARYRLRPATYVFAEISPRLAGYDPGVNQISFGVEGRAGGHLFQLNVSNGFGTTLGQIARGGVSNDNWYFGFNIARKFF